MKIAAIIQARLGSNRLPGKVMMDITGKPMLGRVIERVRMAIPDIIVATPDAEVAKYATSQNVSVFVGSEFDVINRYYQAAKSFELIDIIRITADNPLIDPDVISKVVEFYSNGDYDYVSNNLKRTYPVGLDVEVFSFKTLERVWCTTKDAYDSEHVTSYIYRHPELFTLGSVENDVNLSHLQWTVDYQKGLEFAREIYSNLGGNFTMSDVLKFIKGRVYA